MTVRYRCRVVGGQTDVLVEGEAASLTERDQAGVAAAREFVVDRQRRRSGGQAQHRRRFAAEQSGDRVGADAANLVGVLQDDDFHLLVRDEKICPGENLSALQDRFGRDDVPGFAFVHDHHGHNGIEPLGLD